MNNDNYEFRSLIEQHSNFSPSTKDSILNVLNNHMGGDVTLDQSTEIFSDYGEDVKQNITENLSRKFNIDEQHIESAMDVPGNIQRFVARIEDII
jgi:hypothetical protein